MTKIRVYELAKELNMTSKELINKVEELGLEISSHMSSIEKEEAELIRELLDVNEETKETIYVAKFDSKQLNIIYIEKIQSKRNITLTAGIGSRNYVHSTANGKCLLSGFSDEKIIEILKKKNFLNQHLIML